MPMSLDPEKIAEHLPTIVDQVLPKHEIANSRRDPTLRHIGIVSDMTKAGEGGHYWLLAGGDVVLFASTQVPVAEREEWNRPFQKIMSSLQITRDDELLMGRVASDVLTQLPERLPEQGLEYKSNKIHGKDRV